MSARKIEHAGSFQQVTVEARQTRLSLSPNSVIIHKNGIEFRSATPFAAWTEMTMTLQSPLGGGPVHCTGRGHFLHGQQARRLSRLDGVHRPLEARAGPPEHDGALTARLALLRIYTVGSGTLGRGSRFFVPR